MKISKIDAFQVQWTPNDKPSQRSAFVRVHTDAGLVGLGEATVSALWSGETAASCVAAAFPHKPPPRTVTS